MRWLIDPPTDGATNMAVDEMLLERVGHRESPPTLRFYRWSAPTISLGYFQPWADFTALPAPAPNLPAVRRLTGGGAILHDLELTYSLVLPTGHPLLTAVSPNDLYHHVHTAFRSLLEENGVPVSPGPPDARGCSHRGPFFCFERHCCFDLLADGAKIMGSAQRRTRTAVLQHGSLILDSRFDQQKCATVARYARFDMETDLPRLAADIAGQPVGAPTALEKAEHKEAQALRIKYTNPAWTQRR